MSGLSNNPNLEAAIAAVIKALGRVEDSRGSRDENRSINALVAAATGLRAAHMTARMGL